MSGCTAPREGHRTASGAANCPVCRGSRGRGRGNGYYPPPTYVPSAYSRVGGSSGSGSGSHGSGRSRPSWQPNTSSVSYTTDQVRALTPYRNAVVRAARGPELRDVFLCHAWDDRRGSAQELYDLLEAEGVTVWFSEKDIVLGQPFLREIDRGLARSRTGLVLVTPALLKRVDNRGVSDKELSELLARDLLIPVVHETTYEDLRRVSPLLGSRHGLDTGDDSMADIAKKIAEMVAV